MVERPGENLSVRRQCALLNLARSGVYRAGPVTGADDLALMRRIDELHLKWPFYGSRRMVFELNQAGHGINRKRVQRLMRVMGIEALVPRPGTSKAAPGHKIYPYLLRGVSITEPNHVWASDITYIPMALGFLYLVAIIDWASRAVLAWRLSNTMDTGFCIAARRKYSTPIRARSSPAPPSPAGSRLQASRFRWTDAGVSWTIFSSNGCGARSNTRKCI
jgi:putative transposase